MIPRISKKVNAYLIFVDLFLIAFCFACFFGGVASPREGKVVMLCA
jgi:hypothetical protein